MFSSGENSLKSSHLLKVVTFSVIGVIALLVFVYFLFFNSPNNFPKGSVINIQEGTNLRKLSSQLQRQNIIRSRVAFEAFVIIYEGEKHIIPGDYLFKTKLPVYSVALRISNGEHGLPPVKVTIPEGFNISEIGDAFSKKMTNFNLDNFLRVALDKEGYLFPDTYFFLTTNDEQDVLKYMSDNFQKKIAPIRPEMLSFGKTEEEIITMASIVEEEAKGDADREFISGILWKRISLGIPLQADAAPITYKQKGLPDAPISNPGLKAIKAAIHPKSSPYLYYLHDGEGNIHFARTFEEHKDNKGKYLNQ